MRTENWTPKNVTHLYAFPNPPPPHTPPHTHTHTHTTTHTPIRGHAHVKVYLKLFNEACSNGSWSRRHTSLTLFHWTQWGRRERRVVSSDSPTTERGQCDVYELQILVKLTFDHFCLYLPETKECLSGKWRSKITLSLLAYPGVQFFICLCLAVAFLFSSFLAFFLSFAQCFPTAPFFPSLNPVHYLVWARLPNESGEVCGRLLWCCHGRHWM